MSRLRYYLTETALAHYEKTIFDTARKWGKEQARKYRAELRAGFQDIASPYKKFPSHDEIKGSRNFFLHHCAHHYIAFKPYGKTAIIICAIFHEAMDIPNRLKELESLSRHEIDLLRKEIAKENGA